MTSKSSTTKIQYDEELEEYEEVFYPLTSDSYYIRTRLPDRLLLSENEFEELWNMHPEDFSKFNIRGKEIDTPRWSENYGKDYKFSGTNHEGKPIPRKGIVKRLLDWVNSREDTEYNEVLINWYQDGRHYIGAHSDDERQLRPGANIYTISYGATRDFILHPKFGGDNIIESLSDGDVLIMAGDCQREYKHSLPKRLRVKEPRISVTLRSFKS